MKNLLTILSLFLALVGHAQTRTGIYTKTTTDHHSAKGYASTTIKYKPGNISITTGAITIDTAGSKPQRYEIIKRTAVEDFRYDDDIRHYGMQKLTLMYEGKTGPKLIDAFLMFAEDKKTITDLILKRSKSQDLTYTF